MSAADAILAAMVAEGDTPARALERIRQEDGPDVEPPVVGWDRALYRPLGPPSVPERLRERLAAWRDRRLPEIVPNELTHEQKLKIYRDMANRGSDFEIR